MTSWDFFDTLSGRATGHEPWRLFDLVAGEEYRRLRQEAERQSNKTWDDIFRRLGELTGWPAARIAELKAREWELEVQSAFPIYENVSRLRPGDVIVSDTYFSEAQVRELAAKVGVPRSVRIFVSWDGKFSGRWWSDPRRPACDRHVGDNTRSDVIRPRSAGVQAEHYAGGAPTPSEKRLEALGHCDLAAASRAARLQNPHPPKSEPEEWWDNAAAANVPFLLMAAALVRDYVQAARPARVAFVSRDAILLGEAYRKIYGERCDVFHASRQTLIEPSADFLTYVKRSAAGTLFVDLHGTGKSVRQFAAQSGVELAYLFVCGQRTLPGLYPRLVTLNGIGVGTGVEVMNYHHEGRVVDVVGGRPVRAAVEYDLEVVNVHRAATLAGIAAACRPPVGVTPEQAAAAAADVAARVTRRLLAQHQVHHHGQASPAGTRPVRRRRR